MDNYKNFLDIFTSDDVKNKMSDIVKVTEELAQRTPTIGFHHNFYVPGWIGVIQMMFVENKMGNFSKEPFYDGKNYYEFGNWIINTANDVAELHVANKPEDYYDNNESFELQSKGIVHAFNVMTNAWIACCPEVATYRNLKYTADTVISPAGMVFKSLEANLKNLGYPQSSNEHCGNESSIKEETKGFLYQMAGYILNILLFAAIFGIIGSIFS